VNMMSLHSSLLCEAVWISRAVFPVHFIIFSCPIIIYIMYNIVYLYYISKTDRNCLAMSQVLPCQHTFCRRCLDEIILTKGRLHCPECRSQIHCRVEDLPSNILLVRLLESMKSVAARGRGGGRGGNGMSSPGSGEFSDSSPRHAMGNNKRTMVSIGDLYF